MLSPENWCDHLPADPLGLLEYRLWVFDKCRENPAYRSAVWYACKTDIFYFIRVFVFQFNPRLPGREYEPFDPFEFQREAVRALLDAIECHCGETAGVHQHDLLWEKSREMGATWLFLIAALWLFLFHDAKQILMISRNEKAVFEKSPDSLFSKLDIMLRYVPGWLKGDVDRAKTTFKRGTSSITGEASTGKAGVGGRATVMFLDEFSQIDDAQEVLQRTSDTTGCRVFNGTHLGPKTAFFELSRRPDMRKIVMHWTQHPAKAKGLYKVDSKGKVDVLDKAYPFPGNYAFVRTGHPTGGPKPGVRSPWYDLQCTRKLNLRGIATDLDIDPQGSDSQCFDALRLRSYIEQYAAKPYWRGRLETADKMSRLVKEETGRIKLWLNPSMVGVPPVGNYTFGADISAGTGATPSTLCGMNDLGEKVLEYSDSSIDPHDFAAMVVRLCRLFCTKIGDPAKLIWEAAGPGIAFGQRVIELGFRNVYFRSNELQLLQDYSDTPGWYPTPKYKRLLIEEYRNALFSHQLVNRSEESLNECSQFVYTSTGTIDHARMVLKEDPSGSRENHGDLVIADALMWKMGEMSVRDPERRPLTEEVKIGSFAWRKQLHEQRERAEESWA